MAYAQSNRKTLNTVYRIICTIPPTMEPISQFPFLFGMILSINNPMTVAMIYLMINVGITQCM